MLHTVHLNCPKQASSNFFRTSTKIATKYLCIKGHKYRHLYKTSNENFIGIGIHFSTINTIYSHYFVKKAKAFLNICKGIFLLKTKMLSLERDDLSTDPKSS